MASREIGIGTVKVSRNQKAGSFVDVQSKAIERFFELESARCTDGISPRFESSGLSEGYEHYYLLNHISAIESDLGCNFRDGDIVRENGFRFLRAKGLRDGLRIPINVPLTAEGAKNLGERIGKTMQALYVSYMRNYSFEVTVKANVDEVTYEEPIATERG